MFLHLLIVGKSQVPLTVEQNILGLETDLIQNRWSQTSSPGREESSVFFRLDKFICCSVL